MKSGPSLIVQIGIIIGVGIALGAVDAFALRRVDLSEREAPPSVDEILKNAARGQPIPVDTPAESPDDPAAGETQPDEPEAPQPLVPEPAAASAAPSAPAGFTPTPKDQLPAGQITLDEAKALFDIGAMFVDSRSLDHFKQGHVENAIRIESSMFRMGDPAELALIPREAVVVVYCNGGHCDESENVAKYLSASGYKTVYVLHDGFPGWKAMGFPSATGE